MIREMFEDIPIVRIIVALITFGLVFTLADGLRSKPEYYSGNVIGKHYSSSTHKTGTGVGITSNGGTGVVIMSESEPEKFLLVVKYKNGKIITAKCEPELFYEKRVGDSIEFAIYKGLFTGMTWSVRAVR